MIHLIFSLFLLSSFNTWKKNWTQLSQHFHGVIKQAVFYVKLLCCVFAITSPSSQQNIITLLRAVLSPFPCGSSTCVLIPHIPPPPHVWLQPPHSPQLVPLPSSSVSRLHLNLEKIQMWQYYDNHKITNTNKICFSFVICKLICSAYAFL